MIVSKRLVEDDENVLARKVFVTLVKLYPRGYSILNDGNFVKKIYAASDEEAIRQFNELATKGKLLTESVKKAVKEQIVETKHQTLVESVMSDLDLEVKEAGGKEAWIANVDEQIDDLSHYLNYLKKSAYNEVNRGGNFESTDEVDEAIRNCEKQLGLLKSKKQIIEERKDESVNKDNHVDEALHIYPSLAINEFETFKRLCDKIGLKTLADVERFMKENGEGKDVITALKDYLINELGIDFQAKDESLKENLDLDNVEFDNPGQAVRAGLDAVYKLIKSPSNASIRFFISSMAAKYKMTDLELDYLEDFISNVLEGMNEHSMAMKYRNGKLPIRYAENLTDADNAYVERMFDECKTVSDLQDLLFEAINNLSLELGESLKEDLAVNGEETVVDTANKPAVKPAVIIIKIESSISADGFEVTVKDTDGNVIDQHSFRYGYNASYSRLGVDKYKPFVTDIINRYLSKYNLNKDNIIVTKGRNVFKGTDVSDEDITDFKNNYLGSHLDESKNESLKEDLSVAVNGEEVPVDAEKQPIEEIQEKISIEQVLSDLIKDEFEAIDGYNSSIATLKILENDGSDYSGIIANLEDIKNEELVHVGQLQKCLAEVNPEAEAIDDGKEEASETIAVTEEESAKGEEPAVEA